MRIFLPNANAKASPRHLVHVAPAAEPEGQDGPAEWWDEDRAPVTLTVEFRYGRADVPTTLGKFMLAKGYAARTPLILPDIARLVA